MLHALKFQAAAAVVDKYRYQGVINELATTEGSKQMCLFTIVEAAHAKII